MICLAVSAQGIIETAHDYSHRVSLINKQTIATFENSTDGFTATDGVEAVESALGKEFYPRVHEGKKALWVKSKEVSGDTWRTIRREFAKPLDLRKTPFVQFAIFAQAAPVQDVYVRLTLGNGKDQFQCIAHIIPTLWRTIDFNCGECQFLGNVESMEIALCAPTPDIWSANRDFLVDGIVAGAPIDFEFSVPQSIAAWKTNSGNITYANDAMVYNFKKPGAVFTTALSGSLNNLFSPPAKNRNTIRAVIDNRCNADSIRVSYITDKDSVFKHHSKTFPLSKDEGRHNYFFNLSDIPAEGHYAGIMLEPIGANKGSIAIDRITFEREQPIVKRVGKIVKCEADSAFIHISAKISKQDAAKYKELAIYTLPIETENIEKGKKIYATPNIAEAMEINDIPLRRADRPDMTHLSSRFVAVLSDGSETIPLGKPFFIDNWEIFTDNPYDFLVTNENFNVLDYGAKGDGFTDDTRAFQLAVNAASGAGSGRVVVPGLSPDDDNPYGRRYVITSLELKHDVEMQLGKDVVLWQSGDVRDYTYAPLYGHDMVIPGIPWTHSHFANMPMIYAKNQYRIKIIGPGTIRMCDTFTRDADIEHYATNCEDRIHVVPVVFSDCQDIVLQDFDIIRTNCYHTSFDNDSNLFLGNIKMYDPACVSGDGVGLSSGTHRVMVERCIFSSNDDGVTLSSSYRDPRNNVSPWRSYHDLEPHGARCVRVEHSYFNSGEGSGGKAIAFITWGSTNPEPQNQIIDSVFVTDCVLKGGYSVGTWPDNPFDGKVFTNGETDDFSTVQDVSIFSNEYFNDCSLLCITPTNFRNDCGIPSSGEVLNGDFKDGRCYWSRRGDAKISRGGAEIKAGQMVFQGLTLKPSAYSAIFSVKGKGKVRVLRSDNGDVVAEKPFDTAEVWEISLPFSISEEKDYMLGVEGGEAKLTKAKLEKRK